VACILSKSFSDNGFHLILTPLALNLH
jgi:hypothetical protein